MLWSLLRCNKLTHAWLNLWDKHMTTGRINQVIRESVAERAPPPTRVLPPSTPKRRRIHSTTLRRTGMKRRRALVDLVRFTNEFPWTHRWVPWEIGIGEWRLITPPVRPTPFLSARGRESPVRPARLLEVICNLAPRQPPRRLDIGLGVCTQRATPPTSLPYEPFDLNAPLSKLRSLLRYNSKLSRSGACCCNAASSGAGQASELGALQGLVVTSKFRNREAPEKVWSLELACLFKQNK
jgi:hypothetical protein